MFCSTDMISNRKGSENLILEKKFSNQVRIVTQREEVGTVMTFYCCSVCHREK